jgi:hypothetical protein
LTELDARLLLRDDEQRASPRLHSPVQASPLQALVQVVASLHRPSDVHVSTDVSLEQRVCPGLHTPPQSPSTQAYSHASGDDHDAPSAHRCTRVTDRHSAEPTAH